MAKPLKAPDWFLAEFSLVDGFFDEHRTIVTGRLNGHMSLPLVARGLIKEPFPMATIELARVEGRIRKRLAEEGYAEVEELGQEPKIQLLFEPAPDENVRSPEFHSELANLMQTLNAEDIKASRRWFTQDAVGAGGWGTGGLIVLASTLGTAAIVQLRKGIIQFLKMRQGRKLKLKIGLFTIEGDAEAVERFVTPEQIAKALEPPPKPAKKSTHA